MSGVNSKSNSVMSNIPQIDKTKALEALAKWDSFLKLNPNLGELEKFIKDNATDESFMLAYTQSIINFIERYPDFEDTFTNEYDTITTPLINEIKSNIEKYHHTFSTIRQGTATNTLTKTRAKIGANASVDNITGTATIMQGELTISIPNYETFLGGLRTSAYRLLDALTVAFTENGASSPSITLSLDEYMNKLGLSDRKEARKQATIDLQTLLNIKISFKEKKRYGKPQDFTDINMCEAVGIRNGIINFSFSNIFYNILLGYPVMPYPPQLWKLNSKYNPNSYYLLRKISEHKNMNIGKKNEDIISVKTLLAAAPYLPTFDEVMATDRALTHRIIEPFERDLNAFDATLTWQYCHSNNTPLIDEELQTFNYTLFIDLLIKIECRDYPDQTDRLEAKSQRIANSQNKKRSPPKKKKDSTE